MTKYVGVNIDRIVIGSEYPVEHPHADGRYWAWCHMENGKVHSIEIEIKDIHYFLQLAEENDAEVQLYYDIVPHNGHHFPKIEIVRQS
jgi:hypothetical protein